MEDRLPDGELGRLGFGCSESSKPGANFTPLLDALDSLVVVGTKSSPDIAVSLDFTFVSSAPSRGSSSGSAGAVRFVLCCDVADARLMALLVGCACACASGEGGVFGNVRLLRRRWTVR